MRFKNSMTLLIITENRFALRLRCIIASRNESRFNSQYDQYLLTFAVEWVQNLKLLEKKVQAHACTHTRRHTHTRTHTHTHTWFQISSYYQLLYYSSSVLYSVCSYSTYTHTHTLPFLASFLPTLHQVNWSIFFYCSSSGWSTKCRNGTWRKYVFHFCFIPSVETFN